MFHSPAGMTLACRTNKAEGPLRTSLQSRDGQQPLMEQCQQGQVCRLHTGISSVKADYATTMWKKQLYSHVSSPVRCLELNANFSNANMLTVTILVS